MYIAAVAVRMKELPQTPNQQLVKEFLSGEKGMPWGYVGVLSDRGNGPNP